ncbi:MAG: FecR domain-containing protein [Verrucomicrobiota bacterium]
MNSKVVAKFIEDRDSLSGEELAILIEDLKKDPELSGRLHELLSVDDLLGRLLMCDRTDFESRVRQRVADLKQEQDLPGSEFQASVMDHVKKRASRRSLKLYPLLAMAAGVLLVVGAGIWFAAEGIESVTGNVTLKARQGTVTLRDLDGNIVSTLTDELWRRGCWLETAGDGQVSLAMDRGNTVVEIRKVSSVRCQVSSEGEKRLFLKKGSLAASVMEQKPGKPMVVGTGHGNATVVGTRFAMSSMEEFSRLHVTEGSMRWQTDNNEALMVHASELVVSDKRGHATVFGKPIFVEDFSSGIAQWKPYWEKRDGVAHELPEAEKSRIRIVDVMRDGKKQKSVEIDARGVKGWINLVCKQSIDVDRFVVTFGSRATETKNMSRIDVSCVTGESAKWKQLYRQKKPRISPNKWQIGKIEYAVDARSRGAGKVFKKTYWQEDKLMYFGSATLKMPGPSFALWLSAEDLIAQFTQIRVFPVKSSTLAFDSKEALVMHPEMLFSSVK